MLLPLDAGYFGIRPAFTTLGSGSRVAASKSGLTMYRPTAFLVELLPLFIQKSFT